MELKRCGKFHLRNLKCAIRYCLWPHSTTEIIKNHRQYFAGITRGNSVRLHRESGLSFKLNKAFLRFLSGPHCVQQKIPSSMHHRTASFRPSFISFPLVSPQKALCLLSLLPSSSSSLPEQSQIKIFHSLFDIVISAVPAPACLK